MLYPIAVRSPMSDFSAVRVASLSAVVFMVELVVFLDCLDERDDRAVVLRLELLVI